MCGRYTLTQPKALASQFRLAEPERAADLPPRYNLAPTQPAAVVFAENGKRQLLPMRWGLIPQWMKPVDGHRPPAGWINARSETANTKPAFRGAFKYRRCLIPADGFYEWQRDPEGKRARKQPHLIRRADHGVFAFAGLYEWWCPPDGSELPTCAVLTTAANDTLRPLHERMPVILEPQEHDAWLNPGQNPQTLQSLLRPAANDRLYTTPVSRRVNRPHHDDAACLQPCRHEPPHRQAGLFGA